MKIDQYVFTFSKENKPIAKVKNNEIVTFVCEDCYCGQVKDESISLCDLKEDLDNPATGPIYVEEAKAGDILKVEILDIRLKEKGIIIPMPHCGPLSCQYDEKPRFFKIVENKVIWEKYDISWEIMPMIGVIGCACEEERKTMAVGNHGGNIDSPIISKGTTLYLPVRVEGALLCIGDLHACMADGEMCGNGLEIGGEVDVRVSVIKEEELHWPLSETDTHYYVHTNGESCDLAIQRGYEEMTRLLCKAYNMNVSDASIYMSLRGELSANQACLSANNGGNSFRIGTPKIEQKPLIGGNYE